MRLQTRCWGVALAIGGLLVSMPSRGAEATRILLSPGDVIELSVLGAPELTQRLQVEPNGRTAFPLIGEVQAGGRTVDELRDDAKQRFESAQYRRATLNGGDEIRAINSAEVMIKVLEYTPVYMSGVVARPGALAYRSGMTVRQAFAVAGGLDIAKLGEDSSVGSLLDLQADERAVALDLSREAAQNWRIRTLLDLPTTSDRNLRVPGDESTWESERLTLETMQRALDTELRHLTGAISHADRRIDVLVSQQKIEDEGATSDRAEVDKINELFSRGVVPGSRLVEVRRSSLLSASRALQNESQTEEARRQRLDAEGRVQRLKDQFRAERLAELDKSEPALKVAQVRANLVRAKIERNLSLRSTPLTQSGTVFTLYRRVDGAGEVVGPFTPVNPGDVIEVTLSRPETSQRAEMRPSPATRVP